MFSFFVPESKFGDIFETVDFSESGDVTTVLAAERSEREQLSSAACFVSALLPSLEIL